MWQKKGLDDVMKIHFNLTPSHLLPSFYFMHVFHWISHTKYVFCHLNDSQGIISIKLLENHTARFMLLQCSEDVLSKNWPLYMSFQS